MQTDSCKMLRPFRVENLLSSEGVQRGQEDKVVRLTAPTYDATISSNPRASLKYNDEEGDEVTVGSSLELVDRLTEASAQTLRTLLIHGPAVARHPSQMPEFHIEDQEDIQAVWNSLQLRSRLDHETMTADDEAQTSPITAPSPHNGTSYQLEDYRKLYFNTTNPPLLPRRTLGDATKEHAKTSIETPSSTDAKLTPEGRRQARSAGDRLRARGAPLQLGLATIAPSDRSSHHSRWASYQNRVTHNTFSAPEMSLSACDRQGQDSTMMMDSQTKPLVEPRSEGRGNDESDFQQVAPHQAQEPFSENCTPLNATGKQGLATLDIPAMSQRPLLELFEAELAKKAKIQRDRDLASSSLLEAETQLKAFMSEDKPVDPTISTGTRSPRLNSQPGSNKINSAQSERTCAAPLLEMNSRPCPDSPRPIEEAIRTTVAGFEACLRGLIDVLQPLSPPATPSARVTDDALLTIKRLAEVLSTQEVSDPHDSGNPASEKATSPGRCSQEEMIQTPNLEPHDVVQTTPRPGKATDKNGYPLKDSDNGQESQPSCLSEASISRLRSAIPKEPKEARFVGQERMRHTSSTLDLSGPFRYHGPGPIHLPQYSTRYNAKRASSLRHPPKTEDAGHLRRFQSTRFERKLQNQGDDARPRNHATKEVKPVNPFAFPAVTTRFPTVAQFERSNHLQNSSQQNLIDLEENPDNPCLQAAGTISSQSDVHTAPGDRKSSNTAEEDISSDAQEVIGTHVEARHSNSDGEGEDDGLNTLQERQSLDRTALVAKESTKVESGKGHEEDGSSSRDFETPLQANHDIAPNDTDNTPARQTFNASASPVTTYVRRQFEYMGRPSEAETKFKQAMGPSRLGSDAARLTCPFNAFEPDPTAEVHPYSNVRRSATIADLRHAPSSRPRRPHSERYNPGYPVSPGGHHGTGDRPQHRPMRPLRNQWSPVARFPPPAPFSAQNRTDNLQPQPLFAAQNRTLNSATTAPQMQDSTQTQSHSFSNAGLKAEVGYCVRQLLDLGFGHLAQDRLLMYAEATKGDLVESLDMISEDQRAEDIRRSTESGTERAL